MKAIKAFLSVPLFVGSASLQAQNVGIGQSSPNAPLQFANDLRNRKLVLYEGANNDHQFYGLGVNSGVFRYHVDAVNAAHVFYAATGLSSSNELFRIQGNGNVGIGMADAVARLQFRNEINSRMIVLNESVRNPHNYFGFGINEFTMRYQIADPFQSHVFFAGNAANATGSNELFRIRGNGNVGIGNSNPQVPLHFATVLGKKISLYRGPLGDAGFGVFGNELRMHSDYSGADITFGYDDFTNGFIERFRMRGNGALSLSGSPGVQGDLLVSGGSSAASWQSISSVLPYIERGAVVTPTTTETQIDGLTINFNTSRNTRVLIWVDISISNFSSCLVGPCPATGRLIARLTGQPTRTLYFSSAFYPGGEMIDERSMGVLEYSVAPGNHQFTMATRKTSGVTYQMASSLKMLLLSN